MKTTILMTALLFAADAGNELRTVPFLNLERYAGKWFEVARLPNRFQGDCRGATAEYNLEDDGKVSVLNTCYTEEGETRTVRGTAKPVDETNARLQVRFDNLFFKLFSWLIKANYWVIELDDEYTYAVVGTPDRKYLWVLSREPEMEETLHRELLSRAEKQGFDVGRILRSRVPS